MRDYGLRFGGAALALPASPAAEICRIGDADAALVYLYLLARGGRAEPAQMRQDLKLTRERLDSALRTLAEARAIAPDPVAQSDAAEAAQAANPDGGARGANVQGHDSQVASGAEAANAPGTAAGTTPGAPGRAKPAPEAYYTTTELDAAIRGNMGFAWLISETEKRLGRTIFKYEAENLMYIYDTLSLPPEVILLLVTRLCDDPTRKPSFKRLVSQAQDWADTGINTVERAEEALRRDEERKSALGQVRHALGFGDRTLTQSERRILTELLDAGASPELIARAYDITVTKKGSPSWPYTRGILQRWRAKGIRTPEDVERYDRPAGRRPAAAAEDRDEDYYSRLRGYFAGKDDEHADG